jgi:hypothetical protein
VVARRLGLLRGDPSLRKFAVRGYWEGMGGLSEQGGCTWGRGYCGIRPAVGDLPTSPAVLDRGELAQAGEIAGFYGA